MNKEKVFQRLDRELDRSLERFPHHFSSCHEGWAVLREEVDELWDEVKKQPKDRHPHNLRKECIHVAAMAIRFMMDLT